MRGIYAHVNKIDGRVFYVGQQRCHNNRAYDFTEWMSNNVIHGELKDPTAINRDFHFKKEYKVLDNWSYKTYTRH